MLPAKCLMHSCIAFLSVLHLRDDGDVEIEALKQQAAQSAQPR